MSRRAVLLFFVIVGVLALGSGIAYAAFTTHESNPQTFTAGTFPESDPVLVAQSKTNDAGASGSQVQYGLRLQNVSDAAVDLASVTMRYWFTADASTGPPVVACYYSSFVDCGSVEQAAVELPGLLEGADYYVEVSFAGGSLAPTGSATFEQLAIRDPGGATFQQANDFSFLPQRAFADNPRVTAYVDGALVWGTEPLPVPEVESVQVEYNNLRLAPQDNAISPGLRVLNTGNVNLDQQRLTLRYWFTPDGSSPMSGVCDYAQMGCAKVDLGFGKVADESVSYLEVGFNNGILRHGGSTGDIQLRLSKADFSNFDETDDYSYGINTSYATTTTVTAYLDGELVWGTEP